MTSQRESSRNETKRILNSERGSITRIAKRLGIARQNISKWLAGQTTSARIAEAVAKEIRRIQRSHQSEI